MKKLAIILALSATLGGCLTPSAYRQSSRLVSHPVADAVALYGPPDQPLAAGPGAYTWSKGRLSGTCRLSVNVDAAGRITNASVVALGFQTCNRLLKHGRGG